MKAERDMIRSVSNYPISQLLNIDIPVVYKIPRYQREYMWGKSEWEQFFDDILDNDDGYFIGSIICINRSSNTLDIQELELVDGQQRLTTLSLMLAAIYSELIKETLNDYQKNELYNLKRKLVLKKNEDQIRVVPQIQNKNKEDYRAVLSEAGILQFKGDIAANAGNRRLFKAYRFFQHKVEELPMKSGSKANDIIEFLDKIYDAILVKIEVSSASDAYTLFESLNNRGIPLTPVDLIKNKLLSSLEEPDSSQIDLHYEKWNRLLGHLGDDYAVQERFFRHYYTAFRRNMNNIDLREIKGSSIATRSNLIQIYEKIIENNPEGFLNNVIEILDYLIDQEMKSKDAKSLAMRTRLAGFPSPMRTNFPHRTCT
jgi:uncharacterized protein with ParB-like and HNH nuclease domain